MTEPCRTATRSATRLVMADGTNLWLGPTCAPSSAGAVIDDETSCREVAVRMTWAAFRFVAGPSDKAAYEVAERRLSADH